MNLTALYKAIKRFLQGNPCDQCHQSGAALVIKAVQIAGSGRLVAGTTDLVERSYEVTDCSWLCPSCRAKA
jgi:hypothetical protein